MDPDWTRFKPWAETPRSQFEDNAWQDRNAITRLPQLQAALEGVVSPDALADIEAGLAKAGMSIRLNPYIVSLIDWSRAETDPIRRQFLRWMVYVSSAIYSLHWIKPDVSRIGAPRRSRQSVVDALHDRIAFCWGHMDGQLQPGRYLLGDDLSVLDLYVTVVSRFGPWRERFYEVAPRMAPVVRRVDEDPRLTAFWGERFPLE